MSPTTDSVCRSSLPAGKKIASAKFQRQLLSIEANSLWSKLDHEVAAEHETKKVRYPVSDGGPCRYRMADLG
jgi:hypothetical protein